MNRSARITLLLFLALGLAACDDEDTCDCLLVGPDDPQPVLANVWPRVDGRSWTYEFTELSWIEETTAPTDTFTIDDVDSLLAIAPGAPAALEDEAGIWRLRFDGTGVSESGMEGPLLAGTYFDEDVTIRRDAPGDGPAWLRRLVPPRRIRLADLLARRAYGPGGLLLSGDAIFAESDAFIGTYSDVTPTVGWKYLEANLDVGHTFSMQLVPTLADDVYQTVRVRAVRDLDTPFGAFANTVSVNYLIDQGEQTITDESGQELAVTRSYVIGRIEYAPEVGPVYCIERAILPALDGIPGTGYAFDYEYVLIGSGLFEN